MVHVLAVTAKVAPQVVSSLRRALAVEEQANALTGEQGWVRRLLKRQDGFRLVASNVANVCLIDASVQNELGGSRTEWLATASDVGNILARTFGDHSRLLRLVAQPERGVQECLLHGGGQELLQDLRGEEPATTRVMVVLHCSVSALEQLVQHAGWFVGAATAEQLQTAERTRSLVEDIHAATVTTAPNSGKEWAHAVSSSINVLNAPPDYYPSELSNQLLGRDLRVTPVNEDQLPSFDQGDLYWNGQLYGEPARLRDVVTASLLTVLLGNPGSGKSTAAKELVVAELQDGNISAFARLDDLASVLDAGLAPGTEQEAVEAVADAMSRSVQVPVPAAALLKPDGRTECPGSTTEPALIVLDGLDEIPTATGRTKVKQLVALLVDCGYRILLTSRISGYSSPWAGAKHAAVLPLSPEAVTRNAERWFHATKDAESLARYERATSDNKLSEVVSNPLTLGFVCFVAHHGEVPPDEAKIFERFVDHFLRRKWHDPEHWIEDDGAISDLIQTGSDVAWAMSRRRRGEAQRLWTDVAVLAELEELCGSPKVPYRIYESGLLVPYGLFGSPTSPRFQKVRWMHRVIHEYFAARRLAQLIANGAEDWWPAFLNAALHPAWLKTRLQTFQLLGDTPALHRLITTVENEVAKRDTPGRAMSSALAMAASYCHCDDVRRHVVQSLGASGNWGSAFELDAAAAADLAVKQSTNPADVKKIAEALVSFSRWRPVLNSSQVDAMVDAGILNMSDPDHAETVWLARMRTEPLTWWPQVLEPARATGHLACHPVLGNGCDPSVAKEMADLLIQHFRSGPSNISAAEMFYLDGALAAELSSRDPQTLPWRIALALRWHSRKYGQEQEPEYSASLARLMRSGPQHIRDVIAFGPLLEESSEWRPANPQHHQLVAVARASNYFDSLRQTDWDFEPRLNITDLSLPLAEAIINGIDTECMDSGAAVEIYLWALCVIAVVPTSKTLDKLVPLYRAGWQPSFLRSEVDGWIDYASFTQVLNGHDWKSLVVEARQDIASERRLGRAGVILCTAASIWTTTSTVRATDRNVLSPADATEMYIEGAEAVLLSEDEEHFSPGEEIDLPDGLTEDLTLALAEKVLGLTEGFTGAIALRFRRGMERALAGVGALAYFYERIAATVDGPWDPGD